MQNIALVVEDEPSARTARRDGDRAARLAVRPLSGHAAAPNGTGRYGNTLPDRITHLPAAASKRTADDEDDVRAVIGETLIHEVGHYFGLSEEEIEEIEEHYWRGETLEPDEDDAVTVSAPRKRFGQHFLEPAWVAKLVDAHRSAPGRHVPRDRPRPRRAHAGRLRRAWRASSPSKSIATLRPRCRRTRARTCDRGSRRDFLDARTSRTLLARRVADAGARRRQPALQRRLADPVQAAARRRRGRRSRTRR